jgi:hypothetical protein
MPVFSIQFILKYLIKFKNFGTENHKVSRLQSRKINPIIKKIPLILVYFFIYSGFGGNII